MSNSTGSIVQTNTITTSSVGIQINDTTPTANLVTKNTIKFTSCGIWTVAAANDSVIANTFAGNHVTTCP